MQPCKLKPHLLFQFENIFSTFSTYYFFYHPLYRYLNMKKHLTILLGTIVLHGFSQSVNYPAVDSKQYEQMKQENKIPQHLNLANTKIFTPSLEDFKKLEKAYLREAFNGKLI